MRIGIDARELLGRPTGVGRYLRQLLRHWAAQRAVGTFPHELVLYAPGPYPSDVLADAGALRATMRVVAGSAGWWWEQAQLPRAVAVDRLSVFFAPAYTAPLRINCPIVQTIHDVSFLAHPEWFRPRERYRRQWLTRASARRARMVLTDSEFSALEIHRLIGIPRHRLRVIPLGLTTPGRAGGGFPSHSEVVDEWQPFHDRRPLVLYVGSVFNRRRLPDLIRAFARAAAIVPGARLEIVGDNRTYPYQDLDVLCRSLGVGERVGIRAYVGDDELAGLYRSARVFAFLSEYEGFGLTPLEALNCQVPVVLLDTTVARETCGEAARYTAAGDIDAVTEALVVFLTDEAAHRAALESAPAVLARYRWDDAARATLLAIEGAES